MSIALSFDIGHSSIGWAALKPKKENSEILGCGTVVFPKEDCQNQQRAGFRRQRRHIAATRNRIKRLETFLVHAGLLSQADVDYCRKNPHPWPWLLAAQVLIAGRQIDQRELWAVIRWYAHNRGYDGNVLWAGYNSDPDDVKKVQTARAMMSDYKASSMCETVCRFLGIDPKAAGNPTIKLYFKGENAAFPREVVVAEIRSVLEKHVEVLGGISPELIRTLLDDWKDAKDGGFDAKLPERYKGGLLFGQMKPRFENRIIPTCRITGEKTPSKHSRAFYQFRWAKFMINLRVANAIEGGSRPLNVSEIKQLNEAMEKAGYMNKTSLKKALEKDLGLEPTNLDAMLLVPEMEKALTLNPALREMTGSKYKKIWQAIPESWHSVFLNQLFHGRNYHSEPPSLAQWRSRIESKSELTDELDKALHEAYDAECKLLTKKGPVELPTYEAFLKRPLRISQSHMASGRASYSRAKLQEAFKVVMGGEDPSARRGILEETEDVLERQENIPIDKKSNNHLLRHRLRIFEKTLNDLVNHYADGNPSKVKWVGVEVVRDLVEFSGKTAKEKARMIGEQLWHHRKVSKYLEKERHENGGTWDIGSGLIKKVKIADDMNWQCPYTGKFYSLNQILGKEVDLEHIIPRSKRPTDALHTLVLTFSDINRIKGARTAMQFIEDMKDDPRTLTPKQFKELVSKLKKSNGPSKDDERRCTKRKIALLTRDYDPRGKAKEKDTDKPAVDGFTEGSLTQTSHLNKLAAQQTKRWFTEQLGDNAELPPVVQLSGSVTAATRRSWNMFGALEAVHPEVRGKTKTEIREITHLHHALDAIAIGLSVEHFPRDGRLWELLSKRYVKNPTDQAHMKRTLGNMISFSGKGEWKIDGLSDSVMSQIIECLMEKRVVRHNPRTMRGLKVQQNVWRIEGEDPDDPSKMWIRMKPRNEAYEKEPKRKLERKTKLFGSSPNNDDGKLKRLKGALIVEDNYGVALDPEPRVIPYQQIWSELGKLKKENDGKPVRILRNGDVIQVKSGKYSGVWRIHSIKDANAGLLLDMASPEIVKAGNGVVGAKMNVLLKTLIKDDLELLKLDYSFHGA